MTMMNSRMSGPEGCVGMVRLRSTDEFIALTPRGFYLYKEQYIGGRWEKMDLDIIRMGLEGRKEDLERIEYLVNLKS